MATRHSSKKSFLTMAVSLLIPILVWRSLAALHSEEEIEE